MKPPMAVVCAAVLGLGLWLAGCQTQHQAAPMSGPQVSQPGGERDEYVANPNPVTKAELTIGIAMTWGHPYWQNMITGFKDRAEQEEQERGLKINLVFNNAEEDASKQITQCENLAAQGADAVCMVPVQQEASVRAVWVLNDADIPVILVNRTIADTTGRAQWVCYTGTDTYEGAAVSAVILMGALGGKGKIAELQQVLGSAPQLARSQALEDIMKDYPAIELISQQTFGNDPAKCVNIAEDLIRAYPEINGMYCHGDVPALYALRAAEAAGRDDIKIVGMGGSKDALQTIQDQRLAGTSYQQPYEEGRMGMQSAVAYLMGEQVKYNAPTEVIAITEENADQYEGQF